MPDATPSGEQSPENDPTRFDKYIHMIVQEDIPAEIITKTLNSFFSLPQESYGYQYKSRLRFSLIMKGEINPYNQVDTVNVFRDFQDMQPHRKLEILLKLCIHPLNPNLTLETKKALLNCFVIEVGNYYQLQDTGNAA